MAIVMGPILGFRGREGNNWKVCALWVDEEGGAGDSATNTLSWSRDGGTATEIAPSVLKTQDRRTVHCADWAVAMGDDDRTVSYRVTEEGEDHEFTVPGLDTAMRFAYASCNGFADPRYMKQVDDKNERWRDLGAKHTASAFHLLLLGGDQLYADSIWETVGSLKQWNEKPGVDRWKAKFTRRMEQQVERFYFNLYCDRWNQTGPREVFASIPSVMMWDDHDIFDGWGSHPPARHNSEVYQEIFRIATEHFRVFQLQSGVEGQVDGTLAGGGFNTVHELGKMALAVLDLRSERTEQQVMSADSWTSLLGALDNIKDSCRHLFVLSSVPVVYLDLGAIESAFQWIPGQQELEDDLLDHWRARPHRAERLRLLHKLLEFSRTKQCRVTILSGDVHVGALGVLQSDRETGSGHAATINQLISSGIVHPGPPKPVLYFYALMADRVEEVDRDMTARMIPFPATDRKFIGTRNWLSLMMDDKDRVWAEWWAEFENEPYTKVIHPTVPKPPPGAGEST